MNDPAQKDQTIIDELTEELSSGDSDMIDRVMELYSMSEGRRTPADTEAFGVVLERLAYSADTEKRAELANQLALNKDAPVRLMRRLAFDGITVARPILQYSGCLSESDLMTLASKLEQDHLNAIAHRRRLTPHVTDILVGRGDPNVLVSVTQNASASLTGAALQRLSELAEEDHELRLALGKRPEINPGLFERLKSFVADQLLVPAEDTQPEDEASPAQDAPLPEESEPEAQAEEPAAEADETADTPAAGEAGAPRPVYDPIRDSYASEKNLIKLAKAEMLPETVTCMAKLTGMDGVMVEHCLLRAELSALMVLCKANGFGNTTFTVLLKLRQKHSEDPGEIDIKTMLYRYEAMQSHTAKRIIQYANKKKG